MDPNKIRQNIKGMTVEELKRLKYMMSLKFDFDDNDVITTKNTVNLIVDQELNDRKS